MRQNLMSVSHSITILCLFIVALACLPATGQAYEPRRDLQPPSGELLELLRGMDSVNVNNPLALKLQENKLRHETELAKGMKSAPEVVSMSTVVIVGNYTDDSHPFTAAQYQDFLFGNNPTGSLTDFYDEVSYGQFQLSGSVHGPYMSDNSKSYYGVNGGMGTNFPANAAGFIWSILDDADAEVDFSQYDNDGPDGLPNSGDDDGVVDVLTVICAGGDDNWGDVTNIHPHASSLTYHGTSAFQTNDARSEGGFITIDAYTIQPGESGDGSLDEFRGIGVFAHEFGHKLGIYDLYDIDYSTYGLGSWCLMAWGSGGFQDSHESRPVHMSAWCKIRLGWVIPTVVTGTESVTLPPVETNPVVYKLWEDGYQGDRYFLLENRTRTGFDSEIFGDGVLIWHCNEEAPPGNRYEDFRLVELEEADGLRELDLMTSMGDAGDMFPGSTANDRFADNTNPPADDVYHKPTGAVAENFTFVAGPGSDMHVTLTQRPIYGYTLAHYRGVATYWSWGTPTPSVAYGAVKLNVPTSGSLVGVSAYHFANTPVPFTLRIFEDMVSLSPVNLLSQMTGDFPSVPGGRYFEIPLASPLELTGGQTVVLDVGRGPDTYAVPFVKYVQPWSGMSYFSNSGTIYTTFSGYEVLLKARIATNCADDDADGYCAYLDNCPTDANSDQADSDGDGIGDVCDVCPLDASNDQDGDGVCGNLDNCPLASNAGQEDRNGNSVGDACECTAARFTYSGTGAYDFLGQRVAGAGDVNNDGYDDFLIAVLANDDVGANAGKALVYSGRTGETLYVLYGEAAYNVFGTDVASAGDINGDGYGDVIVGAWNANAGTGRAYVFNGGPGPYPVTRSASTADRILSGEAAGDRFGWAVRSIEDIDGDGRPELLVGAPQVDNGLPGKAYLFSGASGNLLYTFTGESAQDQFGLAIGDAGDVDNDGRADVVVGAWANYSGGVYAGRAYVFRGGEGPYPITRPAAGADMILSGQTVDAYFGSAVASAGDINGDNYDDIVVGAQGVRQAFVYSGLDGAMLHRFLGSAWFGYSVSGLGDIDDDGYPDIAVGCPSTSSTVYGQVFVYSGLTGGVLKVLNGEATGDWFGGSVSGSADIDGDGVRDLLVGASEASAAAGARCGRAYVFTMGFDADGDGVLSGCDNCPTVANPAQNDYDGNGVGDACQYACGDANGDGSANVGDAVFLISYIFKGGAAPAPICVGDANGDGSTNVGDAVYLIAYIFKGGAAPVETCCP